MADPARTTFHAALFALIVVALLGAGGGPNLVRPLLIVLSVGRILHSFGMFAAKNAPEQFGCRGGDVIFTTVGGIAVASSLRAGSYRPITSHHGEPRRGGDAYRTRPDQGRRWFTMTRMAR